MMSMNANPYVVDGTAALKLDLDPSAPKEARIISFPDCRNRGKQELTQTSDKLLARVKARAWDVLASSEMACSLAREDFRGCPYGLLGKGHVTALSMGATAIAVVSLALGC